MSYYGEKRNWKRMTLVGVLIFILMQTVYAVIGVLWMNRDTHNIKISQKIDTVSYNETTNSSSFDLKLDINYNDFSYYTATDVSFNIVFKDSEGSTLAEKIVACPEALTTQTPNFTFSFGNETEPAITGKVASAEVSVANATFVNRVVYEGGATGWAYIFEHWITILLALASLVLIIIARYSMELDGCIGWGITMAIFLAALICMTKATTEFVVALSA